MATDGVLSDQDKRMIRDSMPAISDRPPGFDLADWLDRLRSGTVTVLNGATTATVTDLDAKFNGAPVLVSFGEEPTLADLDVFAAVASGTLTVTLSADNGADILVNYMIDARGR